jgi:hypothetical protein
VIGQSTITPAEIESADPWQLYVAHLQFEQPVTIGAMRAVANNLEIPRVLAFVTYGPIIKEQKSGLAIVGLGTMYASDTARRHSECRALAHVNSGPLNELRGVPVDDWRISKINVYAGAHVIRDLLAGITLPAAALVDASAANLEQLRTLEEYTRNEVAQPIEAQRSVELPAECSGFRAPLDAPVLAGGFARDFRYPDALPGESFREYAFRLLSQLPGDAVVTIELKLSTAATVEHLAALVRQYNIAGMNAELVPERSNVRIIGMAELSTFGAPLDEQVHRVLCQMQLGIDEHQISGEWYADWISVSLNVEAASRFLPYPYLAQARISGSYPASDLGRLKAYYERLGNSVHELPTSFPIPAGCSDVYVHNDKLERGSLRPAVDQAN